MHSNFLLCFLAYLLYPYWAAVDKQLKGHIWKTVLNMQLPIQIHFSL